MTMVTTDGHRLALVEKTGEPHEGISGEKKTLIPRKALGELADLLADTKDEKIETPYNSDQLVTGFIGRYLLDFLKAQGSTGEVRLEFKDPQSAGQIRPEDGNEDVRYLGIMMPLRI